MEPNAQLKEINKLLQKEQDIIKAAEKKTQDQRDKCLVKQIKLSEH